MHDSFIRQHNLPSREGIHHDLGVMDVTIDSDVGVALHPQANLGREHDRTRSNINKDMRRQFVRKRAHIDAIGGTRTKYRYHPLGAEVPKLYFHSRRIAFLRITFCRRMTISDSTRQRWDQRSWLYDRSTR